MLNSWGTTSSRPNGLFRVAMADLDYSATYVYGRSYYAFYFQTLNVSFSTVNHAPTTPGNPSPADGATGVPTSSTLSWTGGDPDDDVVTYRVVLDHSANPTTAVYTGTAASFDPGILAESTDCYWRVYATDEHGSATTGPIWRFQTVNHAPATPGNPAPADGAMGVPITSTLSWAGSDPDSDLVMYQVLLDGGAGPTTAVYTGTAASFDPGILAEGTDYYWRVYATDEHGSATTGPIWRFQTNHAPTTPADPSPADGATGVPITSTLSWTGGDPDSDLVMYQVLLDSGAAPTTAVYTGTTASYNAGPLAEGTDYAWRVYATDEHGSAASGPIWRFRTNQALTTPADPSPADGATGVPITTTLSWTGGDPDDDVVTYRVTLDTGANPTTAVYSGTTSSFDPGPLAEGTDYAWRVYATDEQGSVTSGPIWGFRTNHAPTIPGDPAPADGATGVPITSTLSWTGDDPDDDAVTYRVVLDGGASPTTAVYTGTAASFDPGTLAEGTDYYWRVYATDEHGSATTGPIWRFQTNHAPTTPGDPSPADGAMGVPITSTLSWAGSDPDSDLVMYQVLMDGGAGPTTAVYTGTATRFDPGPLAVGTDYAWRVYATDEHGSAASGPIWRFRTNQAPTTPGDPAPADGAMGVPVTSTLSWTGGDPDSDLVMYQVLLDSGTGPTTAVYTGTAASFDHGILAEGTDYAWRVYATDEHGSAASGPIWRFRTNQAPTTPADPSPADGATGVPVTTTLSWSGGDPDDDVVTYRVTLDTGANPTTAVYTGTTSSFDPGPLAEGTDYAWRVYATDEHGSVTSGPIWGFRTNHAPTMPGDPAPADGATDVAITSTLSWTGGDPDTDVVTYRVVLDPGDSPTTAVYTGTAASFDPGTLAEGTDYYWRVYATDEHGSATTGPIWRFQTNHAPTTSGDPSPADGAMGVPITSTLSWAGSDPDSDLVMYQVLLDGGAGPTTAVYTGTAASFDPGILAEGTDYYWRVYATDEHGSATTGPIWCFQTNHAPTTPGDPAPADGAMGVPVTSTLSWTGGDPDSDLVMYQVLLDSGAAPTTAVYTGTTASYNAGPLAEGTDYAWRVYATDEHGSAASGPIWRFRTNQAPTTPADPSPADGATGVPITTTLSWTGGDPDDDVVTYRVTLDTGANPTTAVYSGTTSSFDPGPLAEGTDYAWRVYATDEQGSVTSGPIWGFRTNHAPTIPGDPAPADGATDVAITSTLSWTGGDPDDDVVTYRVVLDPGDSPTTTVYTGTTASYGPIALAPGVASTWRVYATDGHGSATSGPIWHFRALKNDLFADAIIISPMVYSNTQNTAGATTTFDDPSIAEGTCGTFSGRGSHSVWYAYTPAASGTLSVTTANSDFNTVLAVWTGTEGALALAACHDDADSTGQSHVTLSVSGGTTYYIEVIDFNPFGAGGALRIVMRLSPTKYEYVPIIMKDE